MFAYYYYCLSHTTFSSGALCTWKFIQMRFDISKLMMLYVCPITTNALIGGHVYVKTFVFHHSVPYGESTANRMISISSLGVFTNDPCLTMQSINRHGQRSGIPLYCSYSYINDWPPCCGNLVAMYVTYRIVPDSFRSLWYCFS